jgi:hypothetical protein
MVFKVGVDMWRLAGVIIMAGLNISNMALAEDCSKWQSKVDSSIVYSGVIPKPSELTPDEKMKAISCLFYMEGRKCEGQLFGVTKFNISQILPRASIEIGALYYIRSIYYGKWDHCNGVAIVDSNRDMNKDEAVAKVYESYKKWFEKVKQIGLKKALEMGLDPMDDCLDAIWWYGN